MIRIRPRYFVAVLNGDRDRDGKLEMSTSQQLEIVDFDGNRASLFNPVKTMLTEGQEN